MSRDPRVDPRPGDVVQAPLPHGAMRTIIERDGTRLLYESEWPSWEGQAMRTDGECSVERWQALNQASVVIKVAD